MVVASQNFWTSIQTLRGFKSVFDKSIQFDDFFLEFIDYVFENFDEIDEVSFSKFVGVFENLFIKNKAIVVPKTSKVLYSAISHFGYLALELDCFESKYFKTRFERKLPLYSEDMCMGGNPLNEVLVISNPTKMISFIETHIPEDSNEFEYLSICNSTLCNCNQF